jgi:RHS repeat-associated protein
MKNKRIPFFVFLGSFSLFSWGCITNIIQTLLAIGGVLVTIAVLTDLGGIAISTAIAIGGGSLSFAGVCLVGDCGISIPCQSCGSGGSGGGGSNGGGGSSGTQYATEDYSSSGGPDDYTGLNDFTLGDINLTNVTNNLNFDPVDTFTGRPSVSIVDFSYNRTGFPLRYERFYDEDMPPPPCGNLGAGWMSNYDSSLVLSVNSDSVVDAASVTLVMPKHIHIFTLNADGSTYTDANSGNFFQLQRIGLPIPGTGEIVGGVLTGAQYQTVSTGTSFLDTRMSATQINLGQRFLLTDKFGNKSYFATWGPMSQNVAALIGEVDKNLNAIGLDYEQYLFKEGFASKTQTTSQNPTVILTTNIVGYGYAPRLQMVSDSANNWSLSFSYNDLPQPPIPSGSNFSYQYNNTTGSRVAQITAVSNGNTLDTLNFNWNTTTDPVNAPATLVQRSPSGFNAIYTYSTQQTSGVYSYFLNQKNDPLSNTGFKHVTYLRSTTGLNLGSINSPMPVTQVQNAYGKTVYNYQYNPTENQTVITGTNNFSETDKYSNSEWVEKDFTIDGVPYSEKYQYDSNFLMTQLTDGRTNNTTWAHDSLGNPITIIVASGTTDAVTQIFKYNQNSQLIQSIDGNQQTRNFIYGDGVNLTEVQEPLGKNTQYTYWPGGLMKSMMDANGHTTSYFYDTNGNPARVVIPGIPSQQTQFTYNDRSLITQKRDAMGQVTSYEYNTTNPLLVTDVIYPDSTNKHFQYDSNGNLSLARDGKPTTTNFTFDNDDNLLTVVQASGTSAQVTTQYTYDVFRNRVSAMDGNTHTTTFTYNEQSLVQTIKDPVNDTINYTYDGDKNLSTKTDSRGTVASLTYYLNNRLKSTSFSDGTPSITYTYDGNGNRIGMTDAGGSRIYTPDALNRIIEVQNPNSTISYTYDLVGNRQTMQVKVGTALTVYKYSYQQNPNNTVSSVTDPDGQTTSFQYNPLNQVTQISYPNGTQSVDAYDPVMHRLQSINNLTSQGEVISQFSYTYDPVGNIQTSTDLTGSTSFGYDNLYQLTSAIYPGPHGTVGYSYDGAGNRVGANYDNANELTSDSTETITYDKAGNITKRVSTSGTTKYQWDALCRLISVNTPSNSVSYVYNGDNQRLRKVNLATGEVTNYAYDRASVIAEFDDQSNLKHLYNPGISETDLQGNKFFFLHDIRSDVTGLVDSRQNINENYTYDAFGTALGTSSDTNGFRFVGGANVFTDDDANLQYMWNRWYDPGLGRFISRDPSGMTGGLNPYLYSQNNPLTSFDPLGLQSATIPGTVYPASTSPQGMLNWANQIVMTVIVPAYVQAYQMFTKDTAGFIGAPGIEEGYLGLSAAENIYEFSYSFGALGTGLYGLTDSTANIFGYEIPEPYSTYGQDSSYFFDAGNPIALLMDTYNNSNLMGTQQSFYDQFMYDNSPAVINPPCQ